VSARSARLVTAAMALAVTLAAASASGDTAPSRWERAKDPRTADDWELHVKVVDWLAPQPGERRNQRHRKYEAAEVWLEAAHAESSPDVRLRFDLGEVYEGLEHYGRAIQVLRSALAEQPDHPAAAVAWEELAYAYAHLDQSHEEIAAYDAYLARTRSLDAKATVLGNRAEAEMRLGNLEEAIAGYREAIAVSESVSNVTGLIVSDILARWGLAIALDRSGDETSGIREAAEAARLEQGATGRPPGSLIGDEGPESLVFFVPDYERFYYLGLGMVERAKQATEARAAAALWAKAASLWSQYIAGAETWNARHKDRSDRWLPMARAHLAKAQKQRAAAERRVKGA